MARPPVRAVLRSRPRLSLMVRGALVASALVAWSLPAIAQAGQSAVGQLLFYPCDSCHPVAPGRVVAGERSGLPNDFEGHSVRLVGHDKLGKGSSACAVCHGAPDADPGKLRLADGGFIDIRGDTSRVCYRCHSTKYKEFRAGAHGKRQPRCTSAGCHDPHTPGFIYVTPLLPILGTGIQAQVLPERRPFTPLPPPALAPPVSTPAWLAVLTAVGLVFGAGLTGSLIFGRWKR